jgi:hypothetical protein
MNAFLRTYCSCCFKRQDPTFDYDEIDDLEFEQLLNSSFQQKTVWDSITGMFRWNYTAVPTYDTDLVGEVEESAREYTREEVNAITLRATRTEHVQIPSSIPPMSNQQLSSHEQSVAEKSWRETDPLHAHRVNTPTLTPIERAVRAAVEDLSPTSTGILDVQPTTDPNAEFLLNSESLGKSPDDEQFDPKLLQILTKKSGN